MSLKGLKGSCKCGKVHLKVDDRSEPWGIFICHCSMCPDKSYTDTRVGSGAPWLAVPKGQLYDEASHAFVLEVRSSGFAKREECKECGSKLTMQYDCEIFTTWICVDRLDIGRQRVLEAAKNRAHIHCRQTVPAGGECIGDDGIPAYHAWEPWLPDPCRPDHSKEPLICLSCFQREGAKNVPVSCRPSGCKFEIVSKELWKKRSTGSILT